MFLLQINSSSRHHNNILQYLTKFRHTTTAVETAPNVDPTFTCCRLENSVSNHVDKSSGRINKSSGRFIKLLTMSARGLRTKATSASSYVFVYFVLGRPTSYLLF